MASNKIALWETDLRKSNRSKLWQREDFFSTKPLKKVFFISKTFLIIFIFLTFLQIDYGSSY